VTLASSSGVGSATDHDLTVGVAPGRVELELFDLRTLYSRLTFARD
jgi:hypothetical protein